MKKLTKIFLCLVILALTLSIVMVGVGAEDTVSTFSQLYIGDYDSGNFSGQAHIVFGTVSNETKEYGVIITDSEEQSFKFPGKRIGADGKFGIAIYDLPDGDYTAVAYSGEDDARILGESVPFTKGVSEYTVTYNLNGGESDEISLTDTFAQGTRPSKPLANPTKECWDFVGWSADDWSSTLFDFDAEGAINNNVELTAIWTPSKEETVRLTLDNNVSGQYTALTSAINPVLAEGEQVILEFDINKIYSNISRVMFATQDIAHSRLSNWFAYNGVNTEYAHSSYYYANASIFDNYSGMDAGSGKVAYDANGLVNGVEHWVADDGWYLTGGFGLAGDKARVSAIPFSEGKSVKLVYTAPSATQKASLCLYTKASVDSATAYVLNSAIMDIPANRSDLMRTVQIMLDTNCCLDMNVSNLSCTTSSGQNLGVMTVTTVDGNVGSIEMEEFVSDNEKTYSIEVTNNASTTGFGGADILSIPYGGQLVYEFDIVESNLGNQDVNETGDVNDSATNATMGWFGIGLRHSGSVSNWPWKMMYTNGTYAGIVNNNIGGTPEYPMYGDATTSHWWRLMETGANVKVVYTRATSGNSDGSFIVYKNGEVFAQNTGLGDITGNAAINFMWWDAGPRVLKIKNAYSYVVNPDGLKGNFTSPFGVDALTQFVEVEEQKPSYSVEYYFEDLNGEFVVDSSKTLSNIEGTAGTTVNAEIKEFDHFTYFEDMSTISGIVKKDGSLVLKVYYTRNSYTVAFSGNVGTLVSGEEVQSVKYEGAAVAPVYTNVAGTLGWDKDFSYITEDIIVTAQWEGAVTVTFDANGGETELTKTMIAKDSVMVKPSDTPVKANWEFAGWVDESGKLFDFSAPVTGDMTLKAEYAPLTGDLYRLHLTNSANNHAYITSAVAPALEAGETITMKFDIVQVYSQPSRFVFAVAQPEDMEKEDWYEQEGYAGFFSRSTGIFAPYSGMGTYTNTNDTASDEGWILTGGSAISGDVARWCSPVSWGAPIGYYTGTTADQIMTNGDNMEIIYTPYQSESAKGSILVYKNGAIMCGIKDLPANRATVTSALMIAIDTAGDNLDMLVTNVSVKTSGGDNLGYKLGNTSIDDIRTFVHNSDINYKMDHVASDSSVTGGIGGKELLTLTNGQKLVYEFDIVETLFGEITGVEGHNSGYVGFGYTNSTNVSNWPGVMIAGPASGAVVGTWVAGTLNKGTLANNYGWYKLFEDGVTVRIEYVYGTNNDTSFTIYKVVDGQSEMFAQMVNIPNASAPASVRIQSMFSDPNNARKLIVTNLRSYSESATGVKLDETYAGWNSVECLTTIDSITMSEASIVKLDREYLTVNQYCTDTLIATVFSNYLEDRTVTWSSNNDAVVTVDQNGKIKGHAVGVATITATAADGSSASCEVTVEKANGVTFSWLGENVSTVGASNEDNTINQSEIPSVGLSNDNRSDLYVENWYTDAGFTNVWDTNSAIVADITVYGKPALAFTYTVSGGNATITGMVNDDKVKTIESLYIPSTIEGYTVVAIGDSAFENSLHALVNIPASIEVIHDEAFKNSLNLDTVDFEANSALTTVGDSVFRGCEALTNIALPESVTSVGELAFFGANAYSKLYNLNIRRQEYYAPKFTYEFLGEDTLPIGGYIEPSIGNFAEGVTLEQVMKDTVDSGVNILINVGQARNGNTVETYELMYQYMEKYGGMMIDANGWANDPANNYASYAGKHAEDEAGVIRWLDNLYYYNQYNNFAQTQGGGLATQQKNWRKENNRKLYFTNLLPINSPEKAFVFGAVYYTSNGAENAYDSDGNMTMKAHPLYDEYMAVYANYDTYYRTYIENVNPDVFIYDFYPLWANKNGNLAYPTLNSQHFEQLYTTRYYAEDYNKQIYGYYVPFWNFLQLSNLGGRSTTHCELLWQINTAFVFGSKGYQYYCYNDYHANGTYSGTTAINSDGTKNTEFYNMVQEANRQAQAYGKWLLNANVDHIAQYGDNPNGETINSAMFTSRDPSMSWSLSSTSGKNNLVSYMKYYANNNQYAEGVEGDVRELYFVCNNATQHTSDGNITLNFNKHVTGKYIHSGVEHTFSGTNLTVYAVAGEGIAVLLDK